MSKPKQIEDYPEVFHEILDHFKEEPSKPLTLKFSTKGRAVDFRLSWYTFKNAYVKAEMQKTAIGYKDIQLIAAKLREVPSGPHDDSLVWAIILEHRDFSETAQALRAMLDQLREERLNKVDPPDPEL